MKSSCRVIAVVFLTCYVIRPGYAASPLTEATDESSHEFLNALPTIKPLRAGLYVKGYGIEKKGKKKEMHEGLDIKGAEGSEVIATAPGRVRMVQGEQGAILIRIDHGHDIETVYSNLKSSSVSTDKQVSRGEKIGQLGEKPIYYQVLVHKIPVDPLSYVIEK